VTSIRQQIREAVAKFPEGASAEQIAEAMGRDVAAVRACLSKAYNWGDVVLLRRVAKPGATRKDMSIYGAKPQGEGAR
jgi:hypothetical protein